MCDCLKTPKDLQVKELRDMLSSWLSEESLSLKDCIQIEGSKDCYPRSHDWFPKKCNLCVTDKKPFKPAEFVSTDVCRSIGGTDFKKRPKVVALQTDGTFAGSTSVFKDNFHWVLLIHHEPKGKPYCVVYDPDVTATPKAKAMWNKCRDEHELKEADLATVNSGSEKFSSVVQKMILGDDNGLGPLIRYYYYSD